MLTSITLSDSKSAFFFLLGLCSRKSKGFKKTKRAGRREKESKETAPREVGPRPAVQSGGRSTDALVRWCNGVVFQALRGQSPL